MSQAKPTRRTVKLLWIDDDHRADLLRLLERSFQVIPVLPPNVVEYLSGREKPDIILIDYRLNQKPGADGSRYPFHGTALVGMIRDRLPEYPVYLVSRVFDEHQAEQEPDLFDQLVTDRQLTRPEGHAQIISDANDYRRIRTATRNSLIAVHNLLQTPASVKASLNECLPAEIKTGIAPIPEGLESTELTYDRTPGIEFARWVRAKLTRIPALLYDDLYAATLLGIKEGYYKNSVATRGDFPEMTRYSGVFSTNRNALWWKKVLLGYVYDLAAGAVEASHMWEIAPEVLKVTANQRAKCVVCGKLRPETVGYDEDDLDERNPVHIRCSHVDEDSDIDPPFERRRLYTL